MNIASVVLAGFLLVSSSYGQQYEANWDSLDSRPLPAWYDQSKFGIFIHWGLFSVPSFGDEWFWNFWQSGNQEYVDFMTKNYYPGFTYQDFGPMFTAEFYDPDWWADLFAASGARYVVLTSKHHEGFTMWPSNNSWNWNAMDVGPGRDLLGDLATSIRARTDIHFGVYHSLFEWYNPLYLADESNGYETQDFVWRKTMPELYDLVNTYQPEVIWSDGDWETTDAYWNSTDFLAWLYNDSPVRDTVVSNDRWGSNVECVHGGFLTCSDRYNPGVLETRKWENAMTVDSQSWGYRREMTLDEILTIEEILYQLVSTVSCNGNLLLNIGPSHEGRIIPIFEERLRQIGSWLDVNGEAIYNTTYWTTQNDSTTSTVWYTQKTVDDAEVVYAIFLAWPEDNSLVLGSVVGASDATISLVGYSTPLQFTSDATGTTVTLPTLTTSQMPCQWAWTLRIEGLD